MLPSKIALICVVLPLICVHTTMLVSLSVGNLHGCVVYWSDCHSISATGRQAPEFFVFKALMIPTAVFMAAYWYLLGIWLKRISHSAINPRIITSMGYLAAAALIIYTVTLGAEGEPYKIARRMGVILYFSFTCFAHLVLLAKLSRLPIASASLMQNYRWLYRICAVLLISGVLSAALGYLWEGWDSWENAFEWWFSLFMISLFYIVRQMWLSTKFEITVKVTV